MESENLQPEPGTPREQPDEQAREVALAREVVPKSGAGAAGFSLARRLLATNRHPVLIFGASASGKSTLLMSLIDCLRDNQRVKCGLGAPILPDEHPDAERIHADADNFFHGELDSARRDGHVPDATNLVDPLFIPIDLTIDGEEPVKLAFLEGRGEWYEPIRVGRRVTYKALGADIIDLVQNYSQGLTIIYVAPYTENVAGDRDLERCERGLVGVMQYYIANRAARSWDFQLFLLTKWDRFAKPLDNPEALATVESDQVRGLLEGSYNQAWQAFRTMQLGGPSVRRFFMQYCAGLILNSGFQRPHDWFGDDYDRYPKTLLNWIYENATQTAQRSEGRRYFERTALFPDVAQPKGIRFPVMKRIRDFVLFK